MVVGGGVFFWKTAEIYDPVIGNWTKTVNLQFDRVFHQASLLNDGKVLITAGDFTTLRNSAELYDPLKETWTLTDYLYHGRFSHRASVLMNGQVLITGGVNITNSPFNSAELYDPSTELFHNL